MTVAATTARYAFSFSSASPISSFPFVRNALVAGVLISLSAALLGVPLVLKRLSFIGDGFSHVAFGAMAVAGVLNFADSMSLSLPVTVVCALVLLKSSRNAKTAGDAMLAMLSVGAMGDRLPADESQAVVVQRLGRRLHHALRVGLDPYARGHG